MNGGKTLVKNFIFYFLKLMKITNNSLSKSGMGSFNLILNITLAYKYEYRGEIRFFFSRVNIN